MNTFSHFSYKNKIIVSILSSLLFISALLYYTYFQTNVNFRKEAKVKVDKFSERIELKTKLFINSLKVISLNPLIGKSISAGKLKFKGKNVKNTLLALSSIRDVLKASYIYIMDKKGKVLFSTVTAEGKSLKGNNYAFRPYFKNAIAGKPYVYSAVGVTTGKRGVYFSYPIYSKNKKIAVGVIVLKKNLSDFDMVLSTLSKDSIGGLLSDDNVIISTNKKEWLFKSLGALSKESKAKLKNSKQFVGKNINSLPFDLNDRIVSVVKDDYFLETKVIASHNWRIFLLHKIDYEEWQIKAVSIIAIVFFIGLLIIFFFQNKWKNETFQQKSKKDIQRIRELSQAIEQSTASVVVTDRNGRIEFVNSAFTKRSGYTKSEAIGNNPRVLKSGYHNDEFYKNLWHTIASGKSWKGDIRNKAKDGRLYWESATISPIKNEDGKIIKYIAVKDDISEKKKIEKELKKSAEFAERANKAKSLFLANMSHELRTPLNSILGFAQLMSMDFGKGNLTTKQEGFVNIILKSGEHLLEMINSILDLSKIEAGKLELNVEIFDFTNTLFSLLLSIKPLLQKKQIVLEEDVRLDKHKVFADEIKIKQVLYNLLSNAIKFTPENGKIGIKVLALSNDLIITVWDKGIGISAEDQNKLFRAFEQVGEKKEGGTGLGLIISRRLIELHKGTLELKSEAGKGSEFKIIIPNCLNRDKTVNFSAPPDKEIDEDSSEQEYLKAQKILIVDDNPNNLFLLEEMINVLGYRLNSASSGEEALAICKKNNYSVIFMDIDMPEMGGVEAMKEIKKIDSAVIIVALTAFAMKGDREKYINLGFNDYMSKPVKIAKLEKLLGKLFKS